MATTKLWHIKGRLRDLIEYVENPVKTVSPRSLPTRNTAVTLSTSKPTPSLSRIRHDWITRKKTGSFSRMSMSRSSTGRLTSRCRRWWAKQSAVPQKRRTARRICLRICCTALIAVASCGITSIPSTGISTSSVAPTTRATPEAVVKPGTTSVQMPLSR